MNFFSKEELQQLSNCKLCPRECGVNRIDGPLGYCNTGAEFPISSVCIHKGEEPVISGKKGICNVFFAHCNLQCIYCQNHDISTNNKASISLNLPFGKIIERICNTLDLTENILGFVSPSHCIPQMTAIIRGVREAGKNPVIVYNTNGYDKVETLRKLEGLVNIYLTDFKYLNSEISFKYSRAINYPPIAMLALKEMFRQKGSTFIINDEGLAESGIIVRHLVLPNAAEESVEVLRFLAEEISPKLHISLMSQYFPTPQVKKHPTLNRTVSMEEYNRVVKAFQEFGFHRGWIQDLSSPASFRPDFSMDQPFEI